MGACANSQTKNNNQIKKKGKNFEGQISSRTDSNDAKVSPMVSYPETDVPNKNKRRGPDKTIK